MNPSCSDIQDSDAADRRLQERLGRIRHRVLVLSGKGGVGKSTVAASLALSLAEAGQRVGLLDIDVHGPSIPRLLGLEDLPPELAAANENVLQPIPVSDRLSVLSMGLLLRDRDAAVIWRGPMKYGVIKQFLGDVEWGELDYLVVDSPPGTGDEPLSVAQLVGRPCHAVIVTTPQELSVSDVRRCITFCHRVGVSILGIVENMSGFVCPHCGKATDVFKSGGGRGLAEQAGLPFLGAIPLDPHIVTAGDAGQAGTETAAGPGAAALAGIAGRVIAGLPA